MSNYLHLVRYYSLISYFVNCLARNTSHFEFEFILTLYMIKTKILNSIAEHVRTENL